ncbi:MULTISPECIES: helix-turn-helix domain-containing protein [Lonsdalea]|nr:MULTISPECIES: response regulator transcription factor [Lonsdalea]QPQ25317.1 response regulator transcription factor [Lonsdalea populi]
MTKFGGNKETMDYVFFIEDEIITYSLQKIIRSKIMTAVDMSFVATDVSDLMRYPNKEVSKVFFIGTSNECPITASLVDVIKFINKENRIILFKNNASCYNLNYQKCDSVIGLKSPIDEIVSSIQKATQSPLYISTEPKPMRLSSREMFVLEQLATGKSNKEVSTMLCLSEKTISSHKKNILRKLNVKNIIEAVNRI